MRALKYISLALYLIVKSNCQPLPSQPGSQVSLMSEVYRVKRQAGYVYDKPSVSFDLPARVPTVSTQAPTVDRTRAQMMYYAYPAPAATGGNPVNIGGSSGTPVIGGGGGGGSTATASSGGYNYGAQATATAGAQSITGTGSSQANAGTAQSSSAGSSGYGYNVPSAGTGSLSNSYQTSNVGSAQTINGGSSQTASSSGAGSGYMYNAPTNTQSGSKPSPTVDVSTNAPKYLPPTSSGVTSNDITPGSVSPGAGKYSGEISSGPVAVIQPLDQYLPPKRQSNPIPPFAPSGPSVNAGIQPDSGSGQSSNYIPPASAPDRAPAPVGATCFQPPCPSSSPVNNSTPRPFSPALPATGYLPPNVNSQGSSSQNSPSTPAPSYLPPVL